MILSRNTIVASITFFYSIRINRRENNRLKMLQDGTNPQNQVMDLQLVFNSVMPRAYFVQFLEDNADSNPEQGEVAALLQCQTGEAR